MTGKSESLALVLTRLALAVLREKTLADDLHRVAELTTNLIPASSSASIALLVDGEPTTVAVTDHVALELDLVQYHDADGPCIAALEGGEVRVAFLLEDERFPHFAIGAADQRVNSVLSVPIMHSEMVIGTLNVYSREVDAFSEVNRETAAIMTSLAASAIAKTELLTSVRSVREQLQAEVDEQKLVAQAEGVLVALQQCSAEQAGGLIRNAAERNVETLIETASRIIEAAPKDP